MDSPAELGSDSLAANSSKHDWEMLSLSMSSSAFSAAASDPAVKDSAEASSPDPVPVPDGGEGSSAPLLAAAPALFTDLFPPPSSSDGVSDKPPEPFTEGWKPQLSASVTDFAYASSEDQRNHLRRHPRPRTYADGHGLDDSNESFALKNQSATPPVSDSESFFMASQGQVFSVAGGNVKEVVVNEPDVKLEQKAAPKKKKKKVVHKNGWWDEVVTSKAAWSVAMAAALIGIAVIGRCWRHERDQNQQLRLQLSAKEEKLNDLIYQVSRLKDILGGHHKVAVIGAST